MDPKTENKGNQAAQQVEPKDDRADWITPDITDYDIEEVTRSNPPGVHTADATTSYS